MATIKSNISELKFYGMADPYHTLLNNTLDEYEANMRESIDLGAISDEHIEECRYFEVSFNCKYEDEAIEAIGEDLPAIKVARVILKMINVVQERSGLDYTPNEDIGTLYTWWREAVTSDVVWEWEIEEEDEEEED